MKTLGAGFTSKIKLGYDTENNRKVALKILKSNFGLRANKAVKAEVQSLTALSHPNIIKIYDVQEGAEYIRKDKSTKKVSFMAIELAEGGELFDYVSSTGPFSEDVSRYFF